MLDIKNTDKSVITRKLFFYFVGQFLLAVAFLANGERRKALDLFQLAANGIYTDKFLIEKIINLSGEENTETKALTEYYLKVMLIINNTRIKF